MRGTASPQRLARLGGVMYLIIIVLGIFGEMVVRDRIVVSGDPTATAANMRAMESLWRAGIAAEFVSLFSVVVLAMVYFVLLRPVSEELNLLATFFRLIAIAVEAATALYLVTAMLPVTGATSLQAFTPQQLHALATLAIRSHSHGFGVALLFTGCTFLVHGWLIYNSGFLPKVLGIAIQIAGVCYLANSFALFLAPALARALFPLILLPPFLAELSLSLWLLVKGVDVEKWRARAAAARERPAG